MFENNIYQKNDNIFQSETHKSNSRANEHEHLKNVKTNKIIEILRLKYCPTNLCSKNQMKMKILSYKNCCQKSKRITCFKLIFGLSVKCYRVAMLEQD